MFAANRGSINQVFPLFLIIGKTGSDENKNALPLFISVVNLR